jgi:putative transposase
MKESCLECMILFGEAALCKAVHEFVAHDHTERNYQGLGNRIIHPRPSDFRGTRKIERRQRLGGMLNYYCRPAA